MREVSSATSELSPRSARAGGAAVGEGAPGYVPRSGPFLVGAFGFRHDCDFVKAATGR